MERFFGAHVTVAGGLQNSLVAAQKLNINTIQIHACAPQKWNTSPFPQGVEDEFLALRPKTPVKKVFFHGIYLINLASPDKQKFHLAKTSLVNSLDLLHRMGGEGVIFHLGSMKDQEDDAAGYARCAEGINWIMEHSKNEARLILEVAAGSGKVIGSRLEELAEIYSKVEQKDRVGFGLDTQHLWASGFDLRNNLDGIVKSIGEILTFEKVWAVHLNDSKTELASRKDRHENLGLGLIGEAALTAVVNHPKLKNIPFILETPGLKEPETAAIEVENLRAMIK